MAGMISLLVAICTFRKQWTSFEMLKSVDDVLTNDFRVITPKKIYRTIALASMILLFTLMLLLVIVSYYIYIVTLQFDSLNMCFSNLLSNMPNFCVIFLFFFSTSAIERRFYYINNILRQLAPHDMPKNVFEICSRTSQNDRHKPTIALNEIYSIYGSHLKKSFPMSPPNKNFNNQDDILKEIRKLTRKLENREENLWDKIRRRNIIEVEDFKLAKMTDTNEIIEHLTKLLDIHDVLLDCINHQNEVLSFQILLIIAQIFVFGVFALFSLYRTMYNIKAETNILAFTNVFWLIIYTLILYVIMSTSSKCVYEGKFTGTCCHKVINKIAEYADPRVIEKVWNIFGIF